MRHQLTQRWRTASARQLRNIGSDASIRIKKTVLAEQQYRQASEVFADRADTQARGGGQRSCMLQTRHAECLPVEPFTMLRDADHHARTIAARVGAKKRRQRFVHAVF